MRYYSQPRRRSICFLMSIIHTLYITRTSAKRSLSLPVSQVSICTIFKQARPCQTLPDLARLYIYPPMTSPPGGARLFSKTSHLRPGVSPYYCHRVSTCRRPPPLPYGHAHMTPASDGLMGVGGTLPTWFARDTTTSSPNLQSPLDNGHTRPAAQSKLLLLPFPATRFGTAAACIYGEWPKNRRSPVDPSRLLGFSCHRYRHPPLAIVIIIIMNE